MNEWMNCNVMYCTVAVTAPQIRSRSPPAPNETDRTVLYSREPASRI